MARLAYYRVSTAGQSVEAQRAVLQGPFDREFQDSAVSGATPALSRPGFRALMSFIREGDSLSIYALDRVGRDALDVQSVVRSLLDMGVVLEINGIGPVGRGVGEVVVAVVAQLADLERQRIVARCEAGRQAARQSLELSGRTHRGKLSLGRPPKVDPKKVREWRREAGASIAQTARHFSISAATVSRCCAAK